MTAVQSTTRWYQPWTSGIGEVFKINKQGKLIPSLMGIEISKKAEK
jgi:hypothetical protein